MPESLVSVIVPVFAGERFLRAALESVVTQTHPSVEVIVVNDGSPDRSAEIAGSVPGVRVLHQEHRGVAAARNAGAAAARGDLLAFLDQDDEWLPDKLTRQVGLLRERPEVAIVMTHVQMTLVPGTPRPTWFRRRWLTRPEAGFVPSTWVVRRETFERLGPFDPTYRTGSDAEWLARAKDAGVKRVMLSDVLVRWRVHGANGSYDQETMRREMLRALRTTARRQREAGGHGG